MGSMANGKGFIMPGKIRLEKISDLREELIKNIDMFDYVENQFANTWIGYVNCVMEFKIPLPAETAITLIEEAKALLDSIK
jgi:hypothetical protein